MVYYCKYCGKELQDGAAFCAGCGKPVPQEVLDARAAAAAQQAASQPVKAKRGFFADFKDELTDLFKHPVRLIPAAVLTVIWILFSLLSSLVRDTAIMRVINTITFSNAGMYGGVIGSIGGIFGKAFFAAIITALVTSLIQKKNPFKAGGVKTGFKSAAFSGLRSVAPFLIGGGIGLILYWFFNITSTPRNLMVAVAGAAAAVIAVISGHGLLFSLLSGIVNKISKGKIPTGALIRRLLTGFAAGFAVGIPVTFARIPWVIVAAGGLFLVVGIIFMLIGKNGAKRIAAAVAVILIAGSLVMPFAGIARADTENETNALAGKYSGMVRMIYGEVTDEGFKNYSDGKMGLDTFVKSYMGAKNKLSKEELDEKLADLIWDSDIESGESGMRIEVTDAAKGKCSITFSLTAANHEWKSNEDAFNLGANSIEVTLKGVYKNGVITVSSATGDVTRAAGTIDVLSGGGKVYLQSSDMTIEVANGGIPLYLGLVSIDAEMDSDQAGVFKKAPDINEPITIDDIVGYYKYTGMNYETGEVMDAYFKIEKVSGSSFRFSSLEPVAEIETIDWSSFYEEDENTTITTWDNNVDLTLFNYNQSQATGQTEESINGMKAVEYYPELGVSTEIFNSEDKAYCDFAFSRTESGGIHAVYENHMDFGAGYNIMDHWEMDKVKYLPGEGILTELPENTPEETTPEETIPEPETDETEPASAEPESDEPEPPTPERETGFIPEDYDDDHYRESIYDPDHGDLPHTTGGVIADSVATALIGGGVGAIIGGLAGAGGDGGDGGDGGSGGEGPGGGGDWNVDSEGNVSFTDPSTGKTVKYEQTGYDPDTGEPVYHNSESWGQEYKIDDLKEMFDRTSRESDYYKNIRDTYDQTQKEQREDNQDLSWEAKDWEREKKDIAEQERIQDVRNKIAYKHGVYDGNVNEVKKDILKDRNEEYKKQAEHEARAEYMNAGFQTAQNIQKGADVAIAVGEKIASYTPAAPIAKVIKKTYIVSKNAASNIGSYTAGTKSFGQAVGDTFVGAAGDLVKDSADGFGQKFLYNTTMEGGKTVFQGWIDGKSAEKIRDETLQKMEKGFNDTVNEGVNTLILGDTPLGTLMTELDNMEPNEE